MAIDFNVEHKRGSEYLFDPAAITVPAKLNGRTDLPDITELKSSIIQLGQLQPVGIRNDGGTPTLVYGFSRWRAISEINAERPPETRMRIRCVPFRGDEDAGLVANIHENRKRNETTPLDDANNIAKLERMGKTVAEIAKEYGESSAWVSGRLSLLSLAPEAKNALKNGKLKTTAAIAIAKLAAKAQKEAVAKPKADKPKHWNFGKVKETLRFVVREGKSPEGFECTRAELDVIDRYSSWLLKNATGKEV